MFIEKNLTLVTTSGLNQIFGEIVGSGYLAQ